MKKFITFGGNEERYHINVQRLCKEALQLDFFDEINGFTEEYLINDKQFWDNHNDFILNNRRGFGYYIWKAHIINKELEKLQPNDILVFADAGFEIDINGKSRFLEYIKMLEEDPEQKGLVTFQLPYKEIHYTKKETIQYFEQSYFKPINNIKEQYQFLSGLIIIKKTNHSSNLIRLWSHISKKYHLINDVLSLSEEENFDQNRHDQSIYSMLVNMFGSIKIPEDETMNTNNSKFPFLAKRLTNK